MKETLERFRDMVSRTPVPTSAPGPGHARRIGVLCSYVPDELLSVPGLEPHRLRAPECTGTDLADTYLGRVTCSYVRCILETVEEGRLGGLDGYLFATGCDHMRRLHDNLAYLHAPGFLHLMDVPHKNSDAAVAWFAQELRQAAARLATDFGVDLGEAAMRDAIRRRNRLRELLVALDGLRGKEHPPFTGGDMLAVTVGLGAVTVAEGARLVDGLIRQAEKTEGERGRRARLLLVSSQLDDPRYVDALESTGGIVVGEVACTAASAFRGLVDEEAPPFEALAARYLGRVPCPRMMEEHGRLLSTIVELHEQRHADGIILVSLKFCDTWGWENTLLLRELRERGIPVLRLEREYFLSGEGQIATRVQAFLESLGR